MFVQCPRHFTSWSKIFLLIISLTSQTAHAAFIDFDDLPPPEKDPFLCYTEALNCMHELGYEYEKEGVIFTGDREWLITEWFADGTYTNQLKGFNYISIEFIDKLPNFISLNINSPLGGEASFLELYGENDTHLFTHVTHGWRGMEELSTPYIPNELVSIYAAERIKRIGIYSFYGHRTGPSIDNLTFEYREVPEPPLFILLITGIAGLLLQRTKYLFPA